MGSQVRVRREVKVEIDEVLSRERESFDLGVRFGICEVLWAEFLLAVVGFALATLIRVWF